MVNSKTIVFVLDLIGAIAIAASGVVAKHYALHPRPNDMGAWSDGHAPFFN